MSSPRWYSQNGGPAHAVWVGWDGPERLDYYYTKCGRDVGYHRPAARDGWVALGYDPDPGVKRCARCEKALERQARQAEKDAAWLDRHAVKVRRTKKKIRAKYKKMRAEKRERTIREIQALIAPNRAPKTLVRKIMTIVREHLEAEAADYGAEKAELERVW